MPIPQPLNPINQSGSMANNPGLNAAGPRMNLNKTPSQNLQGRMSFRPPPNPQPFSFRNGMAGNIPNRLANGQAPMMGASNQSQNYMPVKPMPMIGMFNTQAPQMGIAPQMPMNPALGIGPS